MKQKIHSVLKCLKCGREYNDHRLFCDDCKDALLRTEYAVKEFRTGKEKNIFRFKTWLPASEGHDTRIGPCVFPSEGFGRALGLKKLHIAFSGYWPERGALNITGTFKDHEAAPTMEYFREKGIHDIVLSSVGNTARAFGYACSKLNMNCCIIVPDKMLERLWLPCKPSASVKVIVLQDSCDYAAAIKLGEKIRAQFNVMTEGGARNVARRDGMGTTVLEFARLTADMPEHYVQAIGSGTGGIAAYEAAIRLRQDGRFGERLPCLHLVQNSPFTLIHEAWQSHSETLPKPASNSEEMQKVQTMYADVLANTTPPYALVGGVRDSLKATHGQTYAVTREDAVKAKSEFERKEGVSINEPSACACAGLKQAVAAKKIRPDQIVLLHITGGGYDRIHHDFKIHRLKPDRIIEGNPDFSSLRSYEQLFN